MTRAETIKLLKHFSTPLLEGGREHVRSCGQCKRQVIQAEESKIELKRKNPDIRAMFERTNKRWQRTKHFRLYTILKGSGLDIDQIEKKFREIGLEM